MNAQDVLIYMKSRMLCAFSDKYGCSIGAWKLSVVSFVVMVLLTSHDCVYKNKYLDLLLICIIMYFVFFHRIQESPVPKEAEMFWKCLELSEGTIVRIWWIILSNSSLTFLITYEYAQSVFTSNFNYCNMPLPRSSLCWCWVSGCVIYWWETACDLHHSHPLWTWGLQCGTGGSVGGSTQQLHGQVQGSGVQTTANKRNKGVSMYKMIVNIVPLFSWLSFFAYLLFMCISLIILFVCIHIQLFELCACSVLRCADLMHMLGVVMFELLKPENILNVTLRAKDCRL